MRHESLSAAAQVAYSELLDGLHGAPPPQRGISVFTRTIKGRPYWYMQYVIGSSKKSFYLGPDDAATRQRIEALKERFKDDSADRPTRERLVATAVAAGLWSPTAVEGRVYEALAQSGLFAAGGVLIGTHAFLNLGNLLGVQWSGELGRTEDVDVGHDLALDVGVPGETEDLTELLRRVHPDFIPVPALDPTHPSTSFRIRGRTLRVSLLTPARERPGSEPVGLPHLGVAAEPVRFLEYLLQDAQLAAVATGSGILIRVPDPARFALHKLVVSQRRPAAWASRARKDLRQAEAVLEELGELRPGDVARAVRAADSMPPKFMTELRAGTAQLGEHVRKPLDESIEHAD